jgi:hypothetical protein
MNVRKFGFDAARAALSGALCERDPSKLKEVTAAQRATVRQNQPVERFLDAVPNAYASKINRSAIWTARREHI